MNMTTVRAATVRADSITVVHFTTATVIATTGPSRKKSIAQFLEMEDMLSFRFKWIMHFCNKFELSHFLFRYGSLQGKIVHKREMLTLLLLSYP